MIISEIEEFSFFIEWSACWDHTLKAIQKKGGGVSVNSAKIDTY